MTLGEFWTGVVTPGKAFVDAKVAPRPQGQHGISNSSSTNGTNITKGPKDVMGNPLPPGIFGQQPFKHKFAVVIHCGASGREKLLLAAHRGWLRHVRYVYVLPLGLHEERCLTNRLPRHVLASTKTNSAIGSIGFPDNPGKRGIDWAGHYRGAHRALKGILFANDTFGAEIDWIVHIDDDSFFDPADLSKFLSGIDPNLPLFIGRRQGPRTQFPEGSNQFCQHPSDRVKEQFSAESATCCFSATAACPVKLPPRPGRNSTNEAFVFIRDPAKKRNDVIKCNSSLHGVKDKDVFACCPVVEAPREFQDLGFETQTSNLGRSEYHWLHGWPYGGFGYILSKGLLRSIGRDNWEECARRVPCNHADQLVTMCVFNHGFLPTIIRYNMGHGPANILTGTGRSNFIRLAQSPDFNFTLGEKSVRMPITSCGAKGGVCGQRMTGDEKEKECPCHLPSRRRRRLRFTRSNARSRNTAQRGNLSPGGSR